MRFSLFPRRKFHHVTEITPELLRELGVELLILDVDNTIAPYKTLTLEKSVTDWAAGLKRAGVSLFIVSNNKGERPEIFASLLDIPYLKRAGKTFSVNALHERFAAGRKTEPEQLWQSRRRPQIRKTHPSRRK